MPTVATPFLPTFCAFLTLVAFGATTVGVGTTLLSGGTTAAANVTGVLVRSVAGVGFECCLQVARTHAMTRQSTAAVSDWNVGVMSSVVVNAPVSLIVSAGVGPLARSQRKLVCGPVSTLPSTTATRPA